MNHDKSSHCNRPAVPVSDRTPAMPVEFFHQKLLQIHQFIYQSEVPEYGKMHVSTSIGGVIAQGEEIEQAVERADKLMYAAKSQKSCVVTDVDEEVL